MRSRQAVKVLAALTDRIRPASRGLVILIYHRVGGASSSQVDLPRPLFVEQLAELATTGAVIDLDRAIDGLRVGDDLSGRVVLTFDDGTVDFADVVVPILCDYGLPATLFVATRHVDEALEFPGGARPVTWRSLRDVITTGLVTVGSHTHSHALLDRLPRPAVHDELDRSIALIEDNVGTKVRHFAYPKAVAGSAVADRAVRARFCSAALAGTRANPISGADVHRLARSPVQASDGLRYFRHKVDGGLRFEDDLRRAVNRVRYRSATT